MSYPKDIDDYSDKELIVELARRCAERSLGRCDYCRRPKTDSACGSGRHNQDQHTLRAKLVEYGVIEKIGI